MVKVKEGQKCIAKGKILILKKNLKIKLKWNIKVPKEKAILKRKEVYMEEQILCFHFIIRFQRDMEEDYKVLKLVRKFLRVKLRPKIAF